jgi:hypothetical protein
MQFLRLGVVWNPVLLLLEGEEIRKGKRKKTPGSGGKNHTVTYRMKTGNNNIWRKQFEEEWIFQIFIEHGLTATLSH